MRNKFGFDEDYAIYCMSLTEIARERRAAAEAEAAAAAEKAKAVNSVFSMIEDALRYLESDLQYLKAEEIAQQFYHSLEVNNVPVDIVKAAASDYLQYREDCGNTVKSAMQILIGMCTPA